MGRWLFIGLVCIKSIIYLEFWTGSSKKSETDINIIIYESLTAFLLRKGEGDGEGDGWERKEESCNPWKSPSFGKIYFLLHSNATARFRTMNA